MDKAKLAYIEETGLVFEGFGMTRMAGRILGYLLVCDEDEVSFDEIRKALHASKGSISGTTKLLINVGMVEQVSLPGDRKTYFRISRTKVGTILRARISQFETLSKTFSKGRQLKTREDEVSEWLNEISSFYKWVGHEIESIIDRWEDEKNEIIQRDKEKL
jgi:DNA-binding transcriptional regulator GbsR (MarR family)